MVSVMVFLGSGFQPLVSMEIEYAEGFSITSFEEYTRVEVYPAGRAEKSEHVSYYLIHRERQDFMRVFSLVADRHPAVPVSRIIGVPVDRCILLSSTFLPPFRYFDELDRIAAVDHIDNLYDSGIKSRLKKNGTLEVGSGSSLDLEMAAAIRPEIVMVNMIEGEWNAAAKLEKAGMTVVVNGDYLESTPLGRAEWMKFIGLFLGREAEADAWFREVRDRYLGLAGMAGQIVEKPSVILNVPLSGRWVIPGGGGYMARFLEDAGAEYQWNHSPESRSLIFDVETVFSQAVNADVWLHQYGAGSIQDLVGSDPRFRRMKAVRGGRVINNDARQSGAGSNDFYENGPYSPDIILADLISVLHPGLLPEHRLYYYRYLE